MARLTAVLAAATLVGLVTASSAVASRTALDDYRVNSWGGGDGVTLGQVRSIVQDREGYLWLGAEAGLVRFDGLRFATTGLVSGTTLPAAPVRSLSLSRDGTLWVGYRQGRGVYHIDIERGEVLGTYLQDQIVGFVNAVIEDRGGTIWVGHDTGLHRIADGRVQRVAAPSVAGDAHVFDVREDRAGMLWLATASGLYRRSSAGAFELTPHGAGIARAMSEDAAGRIWVTDDAYGFRRSDGRPSRGRTGRGMSLFHDRQGSLWVATIGQGLWKIDQPHSDEGEPRIETMTIERGLISHELSGFLEDKDGNVWVGSHVGLHRLRPSGIASLLDVGVVRALAVDPTGTAWIGSASGLVAHYDFKAGSPGYRRRVSPGFVNTLHRSVDGTLWVATSDGLYHVVGGRLVPARSSAPSLTRVTSIASDRRGVLWLCDEAQGVVRLDLRRLGHALAVTTGTSARPTLVRVDRSARAWVAFGDGTLRAFHPDGTVAVYGLSEGLEQKQIFALHEDDAGHLWVGGDGGLSRLSGDRFYTITARQGLPDRPVLQILSDNAGNLWAGLGLFGFIRLSPAQLARATEDAAYRIRYPIYNANAVTAGVPDTPRSEGAARGPDGRLWFITGRGITILDPRERVGDPDSSLGPPRLESISVDDRWYRATPGIELPPRVHRLRIDYAIINLSSSDQIRFRYRLDGFDRDWVDGTGRRQAEYTSLPPGRYTFRVQAADLAHQWEEAAVDWPFSIRPAFYQTAWFYGACVVAFGLLITGALQLRARQARRQWTAVLDERMRLSREIHDTLLQSLVGVALQLDIASSTVTASVSDARSLLIRTRKYLEEYIREARQSIWALRSPTLEHRDIVAALNDIGKRLAAGRLQFVMSVTGTPRPCGPKVETQVLRIAQEALTNTVRHAAARRVEIHLDFAERLLRLQVADDGRGFNPDGKHGIQGPQDHYGVVVMQERAAQVGGRCMIESAPGAGARVIAEIPLAS